MLQMCLLEKFLLTMWRWKYGFDHCNWSMKSRPNWKQNMLGNFLYKNDLYVRPDVVIFSVEMCILQTITYWKVGTSRD